MRKNKKKIISIVLIISSVILIGANTYAHSGRTDSYGGHKDNNNKSGLGSYHYHCGGYPAHLHTNGVCPYSSSSSSNKSSSSSSSPNSSSSNKNSQTKSTTTTKTQTTTVPANVAITEIQINENIKSLEVGENKLLTATITPSNATDKNITWKSSDESVATISSGGEVVAKSVGTVDITVTSSNGKTNTVKINVKDVQKSENVSVIKTSTSVASDIVTNSSASKSKENSNPIGGVLALGLLGGGGYWGYKKLKK